MVRRWFVLFCSWPGLGNKMADPFDLDAHGLDLRRAAAAAGFDFYNSLADWSTMTTLTFRDPTGPDVALARLRGLIRCLNENLLGGHYTQKVKHSYFSYMVGIEYQVRDVIHFHCLVSRPIDFGLVHRWWNKTSGYAWIDQVRDRTASLEYLLKYVLKGGEVLTYRARNFTMPSSLPWNPSKTQ